MFVEANTGVKVCSSLQYASVQKRAIEAVKVVLRLMPHYRHTDTMPCFTAG